MRVCHIMHLTSRGHVCEVPAWLQCLSSLLAYKPPSLQVPCCATCHAGQGWHQELQHSTTGVMGQDCICISCVLCPLLMTLNCVFEFHEPLMTLQDSSTGTAYDWPLTGSMLGLAG